MTAAPDWFVRALAHLPRRTSVVVDGSSVNVLDWGTAGKPGLVLVHGGAAHARWWSHLAPSLSSDYHVVALDLSGHGDSDRRDLYSHDLWSREILEVCRAVGFDHPPVVVGHSLGGLVAINTAAAYGDLLAGAVIVDAPVRRPDPETVEGTRGRAFRAPGTYPTLDEALTHFYLIPPQPDPDPWILDHVARNSLTETDDGWTWNFDASLFRHTMVAMNEQLASVRCRVALLRGEHSVVVPQDTAEYMYELMGRVSPVVTIPEAHHHLLLDQPLSFITALRTLLADWQHSISYEKA